MDMENDVKKTLAENVLNLIRAENELSGRERSGVSRLLSKGIPNGTAQRVLAGETSIGVDALEQIAKALNVKPWQLLVEGLDPKAPPRLYDDAWPFSRDLHTQVRDLKPTQRVLVESVLSAAISGLAKLDPGIDARGIADLDIDGKRHAA
jgi:transcriptional regulator with XRE-family HTH domain